jgi:hypothetical protein
MIILFAIGKKTGNNPNDHEEENKHAVYLYLHILSNSTYNLYPRYNVVLFSSNRE